MRRLRKAWLLMAVPLVVLAAITRELAMAYRNLYARRSVRDEWRAFFRYWDAQ